MRPIFCFVMALMTATSASSASARFSQKWVTSWTASAQRPLGQLLYALFEGLRRKFIAAIIARRCGGVPCTE
jgi:hypothetical protein